MLLQTRNDIQNLSHKYSLPQLEQMTEELKNAEEKVKELQKDLEVSSAEIKSLKQFTEQLIDENAKLKLNLKEDQLKVDSMNSEAQQMHETATIKNEYEELKEQLNQVMAHLQKSKIQKDRSAIITSLEYDMEEFLVSLKESDVKDLFEQRVEQWKKELDNMKTNSSLKADKAIKAQYKETQQKLQAAQHKIKTLEEAIEDITTTKTIAEGEKCTYQFQLKDCENQLEHARKTVKYLENELENFTKTSKEKDEVIRQLKQNSIQSEIEKLKEELSCKNKALLICEEDKKELIEFLQKTKLQLEESKREALKLQNEVTEVNDKAVRRNLEKELKEAENHLEQSRIEEDVCETEYFKKCLQAEMLKNELKLREDLQQEYLIKLKDIEMKYQKACATTSDLYKEQVDKMNNRETQFREHLAKILAECAQKINKLENDKHDLTAQINYLQVEYNDYKQHVFANEERYKHIIKKIQLDAENNVEEWKMWSKKFVSNCLHIETINKQSRDNILTGMNKADSEIAVIEKLYKDKLKKCFKNDK
ncbi:hypothetical protein NQ314_014485 [Rhamnusium bicolor]|uniref:Uncharacterized protein n=1 Tax=Rhamnusium bicolor TaxID=1586634 RepID=A0AAV8X2R0_9CUCU|nr:hypothetical protein NQ314_014485 [Rhamnusium bicolor]